MTAVEQLAELIAEAVDHKSAPDDPALLPFFVAGRLSGYVVLRDQLEQVGWCDECDEEARSEKPWRPFALIDDMRHDGVRYESDAVFRINRRARKDQTHDRA